MFATMLKQVIVFIALLIWGVIGLVVWIPLLFRAVSVFSALSIYAAISGGDTKSLDDYLDAVTRFYIEGFKRIARINGTAQSRYRVTLSDTFPEFLKEVAWTVIFWGGLAILIVQFS